MNQTPNNPDRIPAGLTPLVQMFPMHIGEPAPAPARGRPTPQEPRRSPPEPNDAAHANARAG